jgi:hypothetical protein
MIPCRWDTSRWGTSGASSWLVVYGRLVGTVQVSDEGEFWAKVARYHTLVLQRLPGTFDTREKAMRAVESALNVQEIGGEPVCQCLFCGKSLNTFQVNTWISEEGESFSPLCGECLNE